MLRAWGERHHPQALPWLPWGSYNGSTKADKHGEKVAVLDQLSNRCFLENKKS